MLLVSRIALFFALAFYLLELLFLLFRLRGKKNPEMNPLNTYPYEIDHGSKKPGFYLSKILLVLLGISASVGLIFMGLELDGAYYILGFSLLALGAILLYFGILLPFDYYKMHLFLVLGGMGLSSLGELLFGLTFLMGSSAEVKGGSVNLPLSIVIGIIGLLGLLGLCNPLLFSWAKMDSEVRDGRKVPKRPRINFLAFYEWLYPFFLSLTLILLLLNSYLVLD